jgi:excisionase family DNA binding protein
MNSGAVSELLLAPAQALPPSPYGPPKSAAQRITRYHNAKDLPYSVRYRLHTMSVIRAEARESGPSCVDSYRLRAFRPRPHVPWPPMSASVSEGHLGTLEPLMSIDEVAVVLAISARGVYRLMGRGELIAVKVGSSTRIEPEQLRRYIAERRRPAEKETEL